jgi:superfamily I DNA/RNA helicase
LEDIALITDQDRDQEDKEKAGTGYVSLMTIHLSK